MYGHPIYLVFSNIYSYVSIGYESSVILYFYKVSNYIYFLSELLILHVLGPIFKTLSKITGQHTVGIFSLQYFSS